MCKSAKKIRVPYFSVLDHLNISLSQDPQPNWIALLKMSKIHLWTVTVPYSNCLTEWRLQTRLEDVIGNKSQTQTNRNRFKQTLFLWTTVWWIESHDYGWVWNRRLAIQCEATTSQIALLNCFWMGTTCIKASARTPDEVRHVNVGIFWAPCFFL